jgi:hypothetical protein
VTRRLLAAAAVAALAGVAAFAYAVTRPDPHTQALADGCARSREAEFSRQAPGWAYVNDAQYPASGPPPPVQWLVGTVNTANDQALAAHPSGGDDPTTHDAFDFNLNVLPDAQYQQLLGGNEEQKSGNFEGEGEEFGRVHIERESSSFPEFAWADAGDRISVLGSWVWDCGHWDPGGERTEIHPYRAVWVVRRSSSRSPYGESEGDLYVSTDATPAGVIAECGHRTKGDRPAFKGCLSTQPRWLDVGGDYDLTLPAPRRPPGAKRLVARVVNQGSTVAVVRPVLEGTAARLRFHLTTTPNQRLVLAEQVFVGWTPLRPATVPRHLRVTLTQLLVRRAMDPSGGLQSTLPAQVASPPGEWKLWTDVAGQWRLLPPLFRAGDGSAFPLRETTDLYVPRGASWRLLVWPHECDFGVATFDDPQAAMRPCPKSGEFGNFTGDDLPGLIVARSPTPGRHTANGSVAPPSTCPPANTRGCYALAYRVAVLRDEQARAARRR